jgi:arylformamidase
MVSEYQALNFMHCDDFVRPQVQIDLPVTATPPYNSMGLEFYHESFGIFQKLAPPSIFHCIQKQNNFDPSPMSSDFIRQDGITNNSRVYLFEKAVDFTQELSNDMPVYPGDPSPSFERVKTIEQNGVNISRLQLGSHTGTHVDAPLHFVPGGTPIDKIPITKLIGEAVVGDFSFKPIGSGITREDLEKVLKGTDFQEKDIVLCFTGCSERWGDQSVNSNFTYLTGDGAKYLVSKNVRAVGIDFLSIEKFHSATHETHKELLQHGVFIIESLNKELKRFLGQRILFIAFPLKFQNGDGAPCRAAGVPVSEKI